MTAPNLEGEVMALQRGSMPSLGELIFAGRLPTRVVYRSVGVGEERRLLQFEGVWEGRIYVPSEQCSVAENLAHFSLLEEVAGCPGQYRVTSGEEKVRLTADNLRQVYHFL